MRDALHQAAVADDGPRAVIDDVVARTVERARELTFGDRHADSVREALPERTGGRLDAGCLTVFRMTRCRRVKLPKAFQVVDRHRVAAEVQRRVKQHRAMAVRQHEAVAIEPMRDSTGCGAAPRGTAPRRRRRDPSAHRVPAVRALHGIHRERTNRIGSFGSGRHRRLGLAQGIGGIRGGALSLLP